MITDFLISMVLGIVSGIQSLVPDWNLDASSISSWSGDLGSFMWSANGYVPEHLLWSVLGVVVAVKAGLLAWRLVLFVYSMIPFN